MTIGQIDRKQPNLVVRDTAGGSLTRGGLGGILAWGIAAIAANNGWDIDAETAAGIGGVLAGGLSALLRLVLPQAS